MAPWQAALAVVLLGGAWSMAAEPPASQGPPLRLRLAWQIALEREGYSPGLIDGRLGPKTALATREYQRARGLSATGVLDAATASALAPDADKALASYAVQAGDPDQVGPAPKGWVEKSQLPRLAYESLESMLAEKFHTSRALLRSLNEGKDLSQLKPGESIVVPAIGEPAPPARGQRIVVNLSQKAIRVLDAGDKVLALFHCSIAADRAKLPTGQASVAVVAENPTYLFDPRKWPEVKGVDRKLLIPPGPRNPVGLCWIGLSLDGYGMHGTPTPEMIGKTGSHGCFRLTNWDAQRLGKMVYVGMPVAFAME